MVIIHLLTGVILQAVRVGAEIFIQKGTPRLAKVLLSNKLDAMLAPRFYQSIHRFRSLENIGIRTLI